MTDTTEPQPVRLNVINRATGAVESTIDISQGEAEMPGYVEHVIRGYNGTDWYAEPATEPITDPSAQDGTEASPADGAAAIDPVAAAPAPPMGYPDEGGTTFANLILGDWENAMHQFFTAVDRKRLDRGLSTRDVADALFLGYGDEVADQWNEWCQE